MELRMCAVLAIGLVLYFLFSTYFVCVCIAAGRADRSMHELTHHAEKATLEPDIARVLPVTKESD